MRLQTLTPLLLTLTLPIAWVAGQDGYGLARVFSSNQDADEANVAVGGAYRADDASTEIEVALINEQEKAELQVQIEELRSKAAQLAEQYNAAMKEMQVVDKERALRAIRETGERRFFGTVESSDFPQLGVQGFPNRDQFGPAEVIGLRSRGLATRSSEDQKAIKLAMAYRASEDEAEKQKLRKQLEEITTLAFKKQLEERGAQVDEAQAKLDRIKARLEQRTELSEKIIERRIADLLDDPDPYAWEFEAAQTLGDEPLKFFRNVPGTNMGVPFVPDSYLPRRPSAPAAPAAPATTLPPASK